MDDSGPSGAIDRIDRALSRAEAAVRGLDAAAPGLAEAYATLDDRHGLLRRRVQETIDRLDTLIGSPGDH